MPPHPAPGSKTSITRPPPRRRGRCARGYLARDGPGSSARRGSPVYSGSRDRPPHDSDRHGRRSRGRAVPATGARATAGHRQPPTAGDSGPRVGYLSGCTASSAGKCMKALTPQVRNSRMKFSEVGLPTRQPRPSSCFSCFSGKQPRRRLPSGPVSLPLLRGESPRRTGARTRRPAVSIETRVLPGAPR